MKELLEYREKLLARLLEASQEFCLACESFVNPFEKIKGEWTVHQIAAHTRDVEKFVYGERVRKTLSEDNPLFKSFDADGWMKEHYKQDETLKNILEDFKNSVQGLHQTLSTVKREDWSRLSRHESGGSELTLQVWVERGLAHVEEHLKILKNK
jgi:hypothetical protein